MERTAIIMATHKEAAPFMRNHGFTADPGGPFPRYRQGELVLVVAGIGRVSAAVATGHCIATEGPHRLFNLGSAGAAGGTWAVGDIAHITRCTVYDGRTDGSPPRHRDIVPAVLPGFREATLATHDVPVLTDKLRDESAAHGDLVDMEGAAFAAACAAFGVPGYLFKVVTDVPGHTGIGDIIGNITLTRDTLAGFFMERVLAAAGA